MRDDRVESVEDSDEPAAYRHKGRIACAEIRPRELAALPEKFFGSGTGKSADMGLPSPIVVTGEAWLT